MSWIVDLLEIAIDNTPIVGGLKKATERDYPHRPLARSEIREERWLDLYHVFVNRAFRGTSYDYPYRRDQLESWLSIYPDAYLVLVRKRLMTWPIGSEKIVASVKVLPLKEDFVARPAFDPVTLTTAQLAPDLVSAAAIWIGDLVSAKDQLLLIIMVLKSRLEFLRIPVYCRTEKHQLRRILFERYGARTLESDGRPADATTILVFNR